MLHTKPITTNKILLLLACSLWIIMSSGCTNMMKIKPVIKAKQVDSIAPLLEKGRELEKQGRLLEAADIYRSARKQSPNNTALKTALSRVEQKIKTAAQQQYQKGLTLYKQGKFGRAANHFKETLRLQPAHGGAQKKLALIQYAEGVPFVMHRLQAGETLSHLAQTYYGSVYLYNYIATYNKISSFDQMPVGQQIKIPALDVVKGREIQKASQVAAPAPSPKSHRQAALQYMEQKQYHKAIEAWQQVLKADPENPQVRRQVSQAHFQQGVISYKKNQYQEARKDFEQALVFDPDCKKCSVYLKLSTDSSLAPIRQNGIDLFIKKDYEQAIVKLQTVMEIVPNDQTAQRYLSRSHFQQGLLNFKQKQYLEARDHFLAAREVDPDCAKCNQWIQKSEEVYKEIHYNRGMEYFSREELEKAIQEWERVQALQPDYKAVGENIEIAKNLLKKLENIKNGDR
jgi:tetratricopeptide (TPR) repeat protein